MVYTIRFNEEKNQLLKVTRRIGFDDVQEAIEEDGLLADIVHPSEKHPQKRLYVVEIKGYVYAVPYVINTEKKELFLKTIYPSRVLTKQYKKGGNDEKKK